VLSLDADSGYGLRRDDLIAKDGDPAQVAARLTEFQQWRTERDEAVARARVPSLRVRTATSVALDRTFDGVSTPPEIEVLDFSRVAGRPFGPRFGTLVHATLATVPLDASEHVIAAVARAQAQILPTAGRNRYAEEEVYAAVEVVSSLLGDPLFDRVREADRDGRCDRELPITWKAPDGTLVEGTIDLAFEDAAGLTVVDFKTDRELSTDLDRYRRQLTVYCQALGTVRKMAAKGILARV
jgi:ATP-dependent exoDNAse (exonuclease V) beta subunit